jgi:hypothetical protein
MSFLLSSVSAGNGNLMMLPSFSGVMPRFAANIAFSISLRNDFS